MQGPRASRVRLGFDAQGRFLVQGAVGKPSTAAILLCLGLLAACTRTGTKPLAAAPPQALKPAAGTRERPSPPPPAQQPSQAVAPASAVLPQPVQPLPAAQPLGLASLRTIAGTPRLMAEDFSLGPLGDAASGTDDQKAALLAADEFLASLVTGAPAAALLSPRSVQAVLELLEPLKGGEAAPATFRLGNAVAVSGGELSANIRLFRDGGTAEGEIYLGKESGRWVVTDVQINPAALARARQKPARKFFPSPYRWLLGE